MSAALRKQVLGLSMKRGRLAVLEAIAFFAWDDGDGGGRTDLKTIRQIATRARYSWRATQGHISTLKADGWIRVTGRVGHPKGCRYLLDGQTLAGLSTKQEPGEPMQKTAPEPTPELFGDPCKMAAEPMQNAREPMQILPTKSLTSKQDKQGTAEGGPQPQAAADERLDQGKQASGLGKEPVRRRHRIPPTWQLTQGHRALALQRGHDPDELAAAFVARYRANGRAMLNWDQAFTSWILGERKFAGGASSRKSLDEKIAETHDHYRGMAERFGLLNGGQL